MDKISNKPFVAIHCLVYNHEPYLRDCFEGFVMQQTNFPFVAIVHDDASTDGSAAIIREYEAKYPQIFKPIYEDENLYQSGGFAAINDVMNTAIEATGAKYVAMCEGDDYWIDPLKLQKQVDFMEANPEYSLCFHKVRTLDVQLGDMLDDLDIQMLGHSTILNLALRNYIQTPSVLYRIYPTVFDKIQQMGNCCLGDYILWMFLAEKGPMFKLDEYMSVYRYGCGIWTSSPSYKNYINFIYVLVKLINLINISDVKTILLIQIENINQKLINEYETLDRAFLQLRLSYSYRIGELLLKPFHWIRRFYLKFSGRKLCNH